MRKRGIDISEWQGNINFLQVKNAGIDCIIVRYADGSYIDKKFITNMKECQKYGFHFGAYIFSRAKSKAQARDEAKRLIAACAPYKYDMPLYIDMESPQVQLIADQVIAGFLDECDKAGVKGGVYSNLNWFNNFININKIKDRPIWYAQYNNEITFKHPEWIGMWQYTSTGKCPGINGNVDLNHVYVEYWDKKPDETYPDNIKIKAVDVFLGKYGSGAERKKKLGNDYDAVQKLVNEIIERMK